MGHCLRVGKAICAVGYSVSALGSAMTEKDANKWSFEGYRMTGISMMEVARKSTFANCPVIVENFIRDNGGFYSSSGVDAVHIVVDRNLVTAQNTVSSSLAAYTFCYFLNGSHST